MISLAHDCDVICDITYDMKNCDITHDIIYDVELHHMMYIHDIICDIIV